MESNWERGRGTTKWVESLNNRRAKLKLCMFDRVRPVVLYCHRLQGIEKRIVVQTVHLVRVILQNKETMVRVNVDEVYAVPGVGGGGNWSTNPYTYSHRAVVDVNTRVRLA